MRTPRSAISFLITAWVVLLGAGATRAALITPLSEEVSVIERVSFALSSRTGHTIVRIHTTGKVDAFSEARSGETGTWSIVLFRTSLSPDRQLDASIGPVSAYRLDEADGQVELRLTVQEGTEAPTVYRDGASTDILVAVPPPRPGMPTPVNTEQAAGRWRLDTVVIDAGHGGKDSGAVGHRGLREKDIVLSVAKKLGAYLEELLDVNVVYTREDDTFIPLHERGRLANEAGGKLFISLHTNSARSAQAHGAETFFVGLHKTEAARQVMEKENEVIQLEDDPTVYEAFRGPRLIQHTLTQSGYIRQSEALASIIQGQFTDRVGRRNRGVKQAGFYVLWSASMPAVLVELGFITNPDEARFLASDDGQTYLASAIFRSVREFKDAYERGLHLTLSNP
ncbi:MAG: N-acetylmuramoyl-L-alanine amidase [Rhodothermales bacterium]